MKKTYLSPLCDILQMDGADILLTASKPATAMEMPDTDIYDPDHQPGSSTYDWENDEEDDWGF